MNFKNINFVSFKFMDETLPVIQFLSSINLAYTLVFKGPEKIGEKLLPCIHLSKFTQSLIQLTFNNENT